jgi:hypothetical protein
MTNGAEPISLAGSHLGDTRHVCAFFSSKDGFDRGDKAIHVVNPDERHDHLHRLAAAEERGQFELRTSADTYLREGSFDQDRILAAFEQLAGGDAKGGFPRSCIVCRMDWVAGSRVLIDDVIEFESRVNEVWRRHYDAVICTDQLRQCGGDTVIDILRTHPMAIVGGILQRNPFYVPPEQFVLELRERRARRGVRRTRTG